MSCSLRAIIQSFSFPLFWRKFQTFPQSEWVEVIPKKGEKVIGNDHPWQIFVAIKDT